METRAQKGKFAMFKKFKSCLVNICDICKYLKNVLYF